MAKVAYPRPGLDIEVWMTKDGKNTLIVKAGLYDQEYPPTDVHQGEMVQVAWFRAESWELAQTVAKLLYP